MVYIKIYIITILKLIVHTKLQLSSLELKRRDEAATA